MYFTLLLGLRMSSATSFTSFGMRIARDSTPSLADGRHLSRVLEVKLQQPVHARKIEVLSNRRRHPVHARANPTKVNRIQVPQTVVAKVPFVCL